MKKANEYIADLYRSQTYFKKVMVKDKLIELIKQAQQDAIEATLILVVENAEVIYEEDGFRNWLSGKWCDTSEWLIDKNSILSLKDELFKELEDE